MPLVETDSKEEEEQPTGSGSVAEVVEEAGEGQRPAEHCRTLIHVLGYFERLRVITVGFLSCLPLASPGAISSLQRQLSFQESELRKADVEKEALQKELRERGEQLEAMSNKFSNLREERKHEEMMGTIERENCKLQQEVTKLEVQLADRDQAIHTLQINIQQLQSELLVNKHRTGKQLNSQNELQKQLDILQRVEQQTRVTLESVSARFERFRSKIIQAAYSTPGTKSPQAEITDEEVLEALQKIITDRLDFHQMLKQKGVKVPSLSSEPAPPPTHKKKGGGK
uniref:Coiled-coil domain-containing protein 27 n=1 Tax=Naja naja TaxID=35670 RepID=A0A8C6XKR4_NAJNA